MEKQINMETINILRIVLESRRWPETGLQFWRGEWWL